LSNLRHVVLEPTSPYLKYLERVLKQDEKNAAALNNIGTALLSENKVEKAKAFYRRALNIKSDFPAALNNLGVSFALTKSYKKAVKYFLAAWSLNRSSVGYVTNLAQAYQAIGLPKNAIKVLEDYLTRGFENQRVRDALALSYASLKDYENSLKHLTKSLRTIETTGNNPQEKARIYNNMAVVYQCMRDFKAAEKLYDLCLDNELLKSPIPLYNAIELYFREDRDEYAKELIDRGAKEFPDDPKLLSYLDRYYFETQRYEECLEILTKVIAIEPKIVESFAIISVIEIEINRNWERAYEMLKKGLLIHPNETGLLNNLAYGHLMQNETTKAREILDKVKIQDNIFLTATRGLLLIKEGDVQEGLHLYNEAKSLALKNGDEKIATLIEQKKYLELGKYYLRNGNAKEAGRLFKKTLAIKAKYGYFCREAKELVSTIG
jgi:tetratricopeptide (TPR) repeat protein